MDMIEINKSMTAKEIVSILAGFIGANQVVEKDQNIFLVDGFSIKAVASSEYFHARNSDKKIQIFYDSKSNTEENLTNKAISLMKGSAKPYEETAGDDTVNVFLEKKLGVEVVRYKKDNQILYRVKNFSPFKSLSIGSDGKSIHSCTFENSLDSTRNVSRDNWADFLSERLREVSEQHEAMTNLFKTLCDGE